MSRRIITISREYASGGSQIGKMLSEKLGIPCYDREIIGKVAAESGLCEKFIEDKSSVDGDLKDYKFMCFNGKVHCSFVCSERKSDLKVSFFDRDWNPMPFERHYPRSNKPIPKPVHYEEMIRLAESLSQGIPFVRVDFYDVEDKIYFGELTFFPGSGFEEFTPEIWDERLGSLINIP